MTAGSASGVIAGAAQTARLRLAMGELSRTLVSPAVPPVVGSRSWLRAPNGRWAREGLSGVGGGSGAGGAAVRHVERARG